MFIEEDAPIIIKIFYKKSGRGFLAMNEKTFHESKLKEDEKQKYKTLTVKMRLLTWGLYNDLNENGYIPNPKTGNITFNTKAYKENKLKSLIVEWDAKRLKPKLSPESPDEWELIPITEANISKMSPDIAEALLNTYDSISYVDEATEKKS